MRIHGLKAISASVLLSLSGTFAFGLHSSSVWAESPNTKTYGAIKLTQYPTYIMLTNGSYTITYHLDTGLSEFAWDGVTKVKGVYSSVKINSRYIKTSSYTTHVFSAQNISVLKNGFGTGIEVAFVNTSSGNPTITQIFDLYNDKKYFLTREIVSGNTSISSNYMSPITSNTPGGVDVGSYSDDRVLNVPFDNDMYARFDAAPMNGLGTSFEVTAIYDNTSRHGLVVGSVTHDTWKTGIDWSGSKHKLNKLTVYGGATLNAVGGTHDSIPHGSITGKTLQSPLTFVGYYPDWRTGMTDYAAANAVIAPPLAFSNAVPRGVPVGWNSWAAYGSQLSYQDVIDTSNYFKQNLQTKNFNNKGTVYINLDSYWDNLSDSDLQNAVQTIKKNGQKAGIYWGPFVYWGSNMNQTVEGTNGRYTYGDIVLRDAKGNVLPTVDGAYAVDPTSPGTKERIDYYINKFKRLGFSYIKLDFLSHGSLEGKHYDTTVQTGIQAYNAGMKYIDQAIDGSMFISESIAPIFPSEYAHSRRISCDTFGSISDTEYELNSLTYGWWESGKIYDYTDPDHMALSHAGSLDEARSRVDSAVISGTVFLNSDDMNDSINQWFAKSFLTNKAIDQLATKGDAFTPVEGNTDDRAADTFVLNDHGTYYLAVFNYNGSIGETKTIDLARAGLNRSQTYTVTDLWTGATSSAKGTLTVTLSPRQSMLVKLN